MRSHLWSLVIGYSSWVAREQALSGRGKSEENKGRERAKRRGGVGKEGGGEGKGPPRPHHQPTLGSLCSLIYFRAFSPLQSLFTG